MRDGIASLLDWSFDLQNPFTQPDDPGVQSRHRSRIETGIDSVSLRLISRLSSALLLVVVLPLLSWFGSEVYDLAVDQLETNTMALESNQEFMRGLLLEQSLQRAEIDGVGEDLDGLRESQRRLWVRYSDINTKLVRLNTLHEGEE
jgi:hypothetical protein